MQFESADCVAAVALPVDGHVDCLKLYGAGEGLGDYNESQRASRRSARGATLAITTPVHEIQLTEDIRAAFRISVIAR